MDTLIVYRKRAVFKTTKVPVPFWQPRTNRVEWSVL
jgi:hypothetical protein